MQQRCPLIAVEGLKQVEIYDEELFLPTEESKINLVQMSSEPHNNFFLMAMDGVVYKYDLTTKELLYQF